MANVKITELTALTDPASTDVLPIVDVVADVTKKISIADLLENAGSGTAAAPGIAFDGDSNTGIYRPGADQIAFATNGAEALYINADGNILVADGNRMEIDEIRARDGAGLKLFDDAGAGIFVQDGGNVGVGTSVPLRTLTSAGASGELCLLGTSADAALDALIGRISSQTRTYGSASTSSFASIEFRTGGSSWYRNGSIAFLINTGDGTASAGTEQMRLTATGLGIGTTSPSSYFNGANNLVVGDATAETGITIAGGSSTNSNIYFADGTSGSAAYAGILRYTHLNDNFSLWTAGQRRIDIDSSGRLLVGTSSAAGNELVQIQGVSGSSTAPGGIALRRSSIGNTDDIGYIAFENANGNFHALIKAFCDGTPGAGDYPGALVFSTTADGASSPTERMRIDSAGSLVLANASAFVAGYIYNTTTASAANVNVDASGFLRRSTSSIKYKENVQDATHGLTELLQLRPVTYTGKSEADGATVFGGLIAEEVDAVGLSEFVQYAEDGSPDALAYGNMVSLCIKAIQEQQAVIEELQAKVAAFEAS